MRKFKIHKGIETPCKIHGLLVKNFYIAFAYICVCGFVLICELKTLIEGTSSIQELIFLFVMELLIGIPLLKKLYAKSNKKKYNTRKQLLTTSNLRRYNKV